MRKNPSERRESLTFCIINYNGQRYLDETLQSVLKHKNAQDEIILVDNASVDRSLDMVKNKFSEVKIISLKKNLGPGAARNVGFASSSNDLILFLDNDICLTSHCVEETIAEFEKRPMAMAAMPCVLYADRPNTIQYDGADLHYLGMMILHNENIQLDQYRDRRTKKIGSIVTACFLIDRRRWRLGKPFDENFFIYFEDHDFGLKIRFNGYDILSVPTARVLHRKGTPGLSLREHGHFTTIRIYHHIRNRWQIIIKFFSLKAIFVLLPMLFLFEMVQFAVSVKKGWTRDWSRALLWIMRNAGGMYKKRLKLQRNRKIRDCEYLKNGPLPFVPELSQTPMEKSGIKFLNGISVTYWRYAKHFL
jgi:GT2 family glycosyltransferase